MKTITLRAADPRKDFRQLAAWFTLLEGETSTETSLQTFYQKNQERIVARVADAGELLGFYWAARDRLTPARVYFDLYVTPARRGQGVGRLLYQDLARVAPGMGAQVLRANVWDNCPEGKAFAERRGFAERSHRLAMALDLSAFDDQPYDAVIAKLEGEGFQFTSLEALGDSEEAQRKLYALNEATGMDIPGTDGEPSWESFEDFWQSVCQSNWYKPGGQKVVVDLATGDFVAMSAITRLVGNDYAYNLHTGVARRYRGRKLGQAVKVTALRYAREALGAARVQTHHNAKNLPMIAIDRKFGYVQTPGTYLMEKVLGEG